MQKTAQIEPVPVLVRQLLDRPAAMGVPTPVCPQTIVAWLHHFPNLYALSPQLPDHAVRTERTGCTHVRLFVTRRWGNRVIKNCCLHSPTIGTPGQHKSENEWVRIRGNIHELYCTTRPATHFSGLYSSWACGISLASKDAVHRIASASVLMSLQTLSGPRNANRII